MKGFGSEEEDLKVYPSFDRSQCREGNTGQIWSVVLVLVSPPAAAFWICGRVWKDFLEQPDRSEFH